MKEVTASFGGIEFFVSESKETFGRRNKIHEFSSRDTPYTESLGRKARRFAIDGFFTGSGAKELSDKFIKACESLEESELVHPFLEETILVTLDDSLEVTRQSKDINFVSFNAVFVEKGSQKPVVEKPERGLSEASKILETSAQESLEKSLSTLERAQEAVTELNNFVNEKTQFIRDAARLATQSAMAINELNYRLQKLDRDLKDSLESPLKAAKVLKDAVKSLKKFEFKRLKNLVAYNLISESFSYEVKKAVSEPDDKHKKSLMNFIALSSVSESLKAVESLNTNEPDPEVPEVWDYTGAQRSSAISEYFPESSPEDVTTEQLSVGLWTKTKSPSLAII